MRIDDQLTPEAALQELGRRLARRRVELGIPQEAAAEQAGVGKRTVVRVEAGEDSQLSTLVRLLRVLGLMAELDRLIPEAGPRPLDLVKLKGKERKRASAKRTNKPRSRWRWGDGK